MNSPAASPYQECYYCRGFCGGDVGTLCPHNPVPDGQRLEALKAAYAALEAENATLRGAIQTAKNAGAVEALRQLAEDYPFNTATRRALDMAKHIEAGTMTADAEKAKNPIDYPKEARWPEATRIYEACRDQSDPTWQDLHVQQKRYYFFLASTRYRYWRSRNV